MFGCWRREAGCPRAPFRAHFYFLLSLPVGYARPFKVRGSRFKVQSSVFTIGLPNITPLARLTSPTPTTTLRPWEKGGRPVEPVARPHPGLAPLPVAAFSVDTSDSGWLPKKASLSPHTHRQSPRQFPLTGRQPHRSLAVVPLIADQRYYGEAPVKLRGEPIVESAGISLAGHYSEDARMVERSKRRSR